MNITDLFGELTAFALAVKAAILAGISLMAYLRGLAKGRKP